MGNDGKVIPVRWSHYRKTELQGMLWDMWVILSSHMENTEISDSEGSEVQKTRLDPDGEKP